MYIHNLYIYIYIYTYEAPSRSRGLFRDPLGRGTSQTSVEHEYTHILVNRRSHILIHRGCLIGVPELSHDRRGYALRLLRATEFNVQYM